MIKFSDFKAYFIYYSFSSNNNYDDKIFIG
jgi:hypothetical protein